MPLGKSKKNEIFMMMIHSIKDQPIFVSVQNPDSETLVCPWWESYLVVRGSKILCDTTFFLCVF